MRFARYVAFASLMSGCALSHPRGEGPTDDAATDAIATMETALHGAMAPVVWPTHEWFLYVSDSPIDCSSVDRALDLWGAGGGCAASPTERCFILPALETTTSDREYPMSDTGSSSEPSVLTGGVVEGTFVVESFQPGIQLAARWRGTAADEHAVAGRAVVTVFCE